MPLPFSKSSIERLGGRLVSSGTIVEADRGQLNELLTAYSETLRWVASRVQDELGVAPTARIKNTGTIVEKLERHGGSWLKSLQDIAGMRIVGDFGRAEQDALVAELLELFRDEPRAPKVIDRREASVQGYRAVHVIVYLEGVPVEIQVRTQRQHAWAELFEKLADLLGRGIRYGDPPLDPLPMQVPQHVAGGVDPVDLARQLHKIRTEMRVTLVELAGSVADLIAAVERAEQAVPGSPDLAPYQDAADEAIKSLRQRVDELATELRG